MKRITAFALFALLSACAAQTERPQPDPDEGQTRPQARPDGAAAAGGASLGTTIASLGSPAEGGFWLKTPLVQTETPGRVVFPGTGQTVEVDLRPRGTEPGGGSQISLDAMRALGAPLGGLPEVEVFRR
ncbi:MAG: D-galactarate dehydratase [Rhodosalinus sp.]